MRTERTAAPSGRNLRRKVTPMGSLALGSPQALGDGIQHGRPNQRELVHQRVELTVTDDEQARDALRPNRRGPGAPVEQRDLAEEVAGAHRRNRSVAVEHHQPTVEDEEELVADLALLCEDAVQADLDLVRQLAEPLELAAAHVGEERDGPEMLELFVARHCRRVYDAALTFHGMLAHRNAHWGNKQPRHHERSSHGFTARWLAEAAREGVFFFVHLYRQDADVDRKSTRLNSSHLVISYAV